MIGDGMGSSQNDWAEHDNDDSGVVNEVLDFDRTIDAILDFAEKDGETLVIITADHETGGFTVNGGNIAEGRVHGAFTSEDHTAVMVPVFAFGPGAKESSGIMDNTDIFNKIADAFQFTQIKTN